MSEPTHIIVHGANTHNLRGVSVEVPRNALVVFTGVSGSGKSSLVFDTIYKEGQRRFLESLSAYARQFLGQMDRPDVDSVEGLSPSLSIDQKTVHRNPRSTVGTITEVYDHLRLLMARLGQAHCPLCGIPIERLSIGQILKKVESLKQVGRVHVLAPVVVDRKGEYRREMDGLFQDGWVRARIDGEYCGLESPPTLERYEKHTIEVVVDRFVMEKAERSRLSEEIETALELSEGVVIFAFEGSESMFSLERGCPVHPDVSVPELEPRQFSFNMPQGACQDCNGLGKKEEFDKHLLVDMNQSGDSALCFLNQEGRIPFSHFDIPALRRVLTKLGAPKKKPIKTWTISLQDRFFFGDPDIEYTLKWQATEKRREVRKYRWSGIIPMMDRIYRFSDHGRWQPYRKHMVCEQCHGGRLNPIAQGVTFRDQSITTLSQMTIGHLAEFFKGVELTDKESPVGKPLLAEINHRLSFLANVGLGYLSLHRSAGSLSGGEAQRIRLAAQVGSGLQGVTYVLDEPSIGLHARDNRKLLEALKALRDRGNSVLVVEHDEDTMLSADWIVELGPGAGFDGGCVTASCEPEEFWNTDTITAKYLRREQTIEMPSHRREVSDWLEIRGACVNNLQNLDVDVPLGTFTVVTGVSGSGKSTLVFEVLEKNLRRALAGDVRREGCSEMGNWEKIDKIIKISQQPIGRTPRSNPATYTGVFDWIRGLFASTPESKVRGYAKGRFSFNVAGGRCEVCEGAGVKTIEMQFLPSVSVTCDVCGGRRFNVETLEIAYKGASIHDVLCMTIAQAAEFFEAVPRVQRVLQTMLDVGLGYVTLGQQSTTLSGGEAQRVKLASELHRPGTGRTLYLLDEPTTGLHLADVGALMTALQRLVDRGNTLMIIEHHTDMIKCADYILDLGPEGGEGGGRLIGSGTPESVAVLDTPTGRVLAAQPEFGGGVATQPTSKQRRLPLASDESERALVLRGVKKHNLQSIDVSIPHGKLTVVTGVSGSGKSTLAFDTIFAEGQRRYVESLSTYARRFLGRLDRAEIEQIEGLQPAIAIDQRASSHNPRSTVSTVTEIHDILRVLYSRIGEIHCPHCGVLVLGHPAEAIGPILKTKEVSLGWLCAPLSGVLEDVEGLHRRFMAEGWTRVLVLSAKGELEERRLDGTDGVQVLADGVQLVVDRLNPGRASRHRVSEGVAKAYALGGDTAHFIERETGDSYAFFRFPTCENHGTILKTALTPRHFSFNSRVGACPRCEGLGHTRQINLDGLFPNRAVGFWASIDGRVGGMLSRSPRKRALIAAVLAHFSMDEETALSKWSPKMWKGVLYGVEKDFKLEWRKRWGKVTRNVSEQRPWPGLVNILEGWRSELKWLTTRQVCPQCRGGRLQPLSLGTQIEGFSIQDFSQQTVAQALETIEDWNFSGEKAVIAARPLLELRSRLGFLKDVGLEYVSLDRTAQSLSGGEAQRIRLASQLGAGLTGVTYVLDEPTIGLHATDTDRMLTTLEGLRDLGNTVVLVEHDSNTIRRCDHVIDLGPGAGRLGGKVVAVGTPEDLMGNQESITGQFLSGAQQIPSREGVRRPRSWVTLKHPQTNNLKMREAKIPLGVWVGVTGVSGSGKSSLVMDTLAPALKGVVGHESTQNSPHNLVLTEPIARLLVVDQSPIGRSPRSTPATYCGILGPLRTLFASTNTARERGWKPGRFSFNSAAGRCEQCAGRGSILIEMHFLPDVWIVCDGCDGLRYRASTLEVRWNGYSIADVLTMPIEEALTHFRHHKAVAGRLQALFDVGLGYLSLGQSANTLSGGEAQRVKLAAELVSRKGHCVYILDEPTTGLHMADIAKLVEVLQRLVSKGHTVVTIEHQIDVLWQADWLIDLGPAGGSGGGEIMAEGPPQAVAQSDSATARALRKFHVDRALSS